MCGYGGIGRRAWFRSMYSQGCGGSSPLIRTIDFQCSNKKPHPRRVRLLVSVERRVVPQVFELSENSIRHVHQLPFMLVCEPIGADEHRAFLKAVFIAGTAPDPWGLRGPDQAVSLRADRPDHRSEAVYMRIRPGGEKHGIPRHLSAAPAM